MKTDAIAKKTFIERVGDELSSFDRLNVPCARKENFDVFYIRPTCMWNKISKSEAARIIYVIAVLDNILRIIKLAENGEWSYVDKLKYLLAVKTKIKC